MFVRVHALLLLLLAAGTADAKRAGVGLDLDATFPAYLRDKVRTQLEQSLAAAGDTVAPGNCERNTCGAELVVSARIVKPDDSSTITLKVFDGASGDLLAESVQVCELCGEAELLEKFGIAVSAVRAKAADALAKRAAPPPPIVVAPVVPRTEHVQRSRVPGIAVGAVGVAAVGLGVVALVLDGRGTCSPGDTPVFPDPGAVIRFPDPDDPSRYVCREIYQTKTLGWIATGVGAAAIATGVALVVRANRGTTVEVAPAVAGATIKATFRW
jgi:hypothetical protein